MVQYSLSVFISGFALEVYIRVFELDSGVNFARWMIILRQRSRISSSSGSGSSCLEV